MSVNGGENMSESKYAFKYMEDVSLGPVIFKNTFKAESVNDGHEYAIRKVAISEKAIGYCSKELQILKSLDKNYVVPYDEFWADENYYIKQNYQDVNTNFNYGSLYIPHYSHLLHIKLPLYSLTLRNIIDTLRVNYFDKVSNTLTPGGYFVASQLFTDIVTAVKYLHERSPPVYHRNLKPENVMLTIDGSTPDNFVRLSDFGLSALDSDHYHAFSHYNAPEVNNFRDFSAKSDIYSLGVIAYQLFNINFNSALQYHDDTLQVKHHHLTDTISKLMSVFIENRKSCAEILKNSGLWSLCYSDVEYDPTISDIVSNTMQINSKEDAFIAHFVRSKSKQISTTAHMVRMVSTTNMSEEPVSPNKLCSPKQNKPFIYMQPSPKRRMSSNKKPIFLSYARRDASPHARSLKKWLNHNGCEVFLDVDEIKVGNDWQDDLNNAVISCVLFVALVTPTYGTTKWTKRELQLADTLNKTIIPISFIDNWPPVEIAINLLSTHFIPWKTDAEINASCDTVDGQKYNISRWEEPYVQRIAKEISDKLQSMYQKKFLSPLVSSKNNFQSSLCANLSAKTNGEHSIVVSFHPNQHEFAHQLRDELDMFGYSTWMSTDDQQINIEDSEQLSLEFATQSLNSFSLSDTLEKLLPSNAILSRINSKTYQCSLSQLSNNLVSDSDTILLKFRERINSASVVIMVLSEDYCQSQTCKQQAFYCDQRIPVIAIKYDSFQVPNELTKVYEEENIIEKYNSIDNTFIANLKEKIDKLASMPKIKCNFNKFNGFEDRMYCLAQQFRNQVLIFDDKSICVYIASSGKPLSIRAQVILKEIGMHLASIKSLKLIIGDSNCNEHVIAGSFIEEASNDANVYHILPEGMNALKGQTLNVGQSVKERDAVVSQLINFCLLIDTDNEAIHLAEKFSWNDKYVIPVIVEEIDEHKHSLLPQVIKDMPYGVKTEDWNALFDLSETPKIIAIAVNNIITRLNSSIYNFDDEICKD